MKRRTFGALSTAALGGGALAAMGATGPALAADLLEHDVVIETPDGRADAVFVRPPQGQHPAVLVWPDILGLREAYRLIARRLASAGYAALVVNPYYRRLPAPVVKPGASFQDQATRELVLPLARSLTPQTNVTDAKAFLAWLDAQSSVDTKRRVGTIGYCMGGAMTFRTAATVPGRVGAGASFHGGRLVTDSLDSPHRLVPLMNAGFLVAVAENDDERDPVAKDVLRQAFEAAELQASVAVFEGALHGWCTPDSRVYNEPQAENAWAQLMTLFEVELG